MKTALTAGRRGQETMVAPEQHMPDIRIGFANMQSWEFTQRVARGFASSSLVPESYRMMVPAGKFGKARLELVENPNAIPNCIIALNMAERLRADPLMVMQHLYIVEGRPAWSAQFVIASINSSGRYSTIQYEMSHEGDQIVDYEVDVWDETVREKVPVKKRVTVPGLSCIAWVTDKASGARLESAKITMEMAVREGWYDRKGSKWQSPLRDQMLRYRAASFFGRIYCPDLLMGLRTVDEEKEILDAEQMANGSWAVTVRSDEDTSVAQRSVAPARISEEITIPVDLGKPRDASPEMLETKPSTPSEAEQGLREALSRGQRPKPDEAAPETKPATRRTTASRADQGGMDLGDTRQAPPDDDGFGTGE